VTDFKTCCRFIALKFALSGLHAQQAMEVLKPSTRATSEEKMPKVNDTEEQALYKVLRQK
jgi:hypothetical protein